MALKDKLVTLEDLAQLKNWVKGSVDMWQDITSSLTWSNATWYWNSNNEQVKSTDSGYNANGTAGIKVAKVSVSKGEKYKIYSWVKYMGTYASGTANGRCYPAFLADASDNIIATMAYEAVGSGTYAGPSSSVGWFGETKVTIPAGAKYLYIFDYAGHAEIGRTSGDIIVEKAQ